MNGSRLLLKTKFFSAIILQNVFIILPGLLWVQLDQVVLEILLDLVYPEMRQ